MYISCPSCQSTKVKKNGFTHYGKQNYACNCCGRQFVLDNHHTKTNSLKLLIKQALKERVSLRAICRIFSVSMNWLKTFSRELWDQTPRNIGITEKEVETVKKVQVFGIQLDELWSFVAKKENKRWVWVAYDPVNRLVSAHHVGSRNIRSAKKFWKKIPDKLKNCYFETDDRKAYKHIIPKKQHKIGKDLTYYIEGFNATIRARVSRLVRKTLSFSKKDKWHNLAIAWFFWQFNLERQPYI